MNNKTTKYNEDILTLYYEDIASNCKDIPFYDVNITMFPSIDEELRLIADVIIYVVPIDNPDIPYMSRILKGIFANYCLVRDMKHRNREIQYNTKNLEEKLRERKLNKKISKLFD